MTYRLSAALLKQHHISPNKRLGQHFLLDAQLTDKIVRLAGNVSGETIVEVGPGPGLLTHSLLQAGAEKVIAIETDQQMVDFLKAELLPTFGDRVELIHQDALKISLADIVKKPVKIIANLPYQIGTPLLLKWYQQRAMVQSITVMLQKEVVERICAQPGTKAYGRLAVKSQWLCDAEHLFDIPPQAFYPPPQIDSAVVKLIPRDAPAYPAEESALDALTVTIFQQRRKMLRASLKRLIKDPETILKKLEIEPTTRPETLDLESLCALSHFIQTRGQD